MLKGLNNFTLNFMYFFVFFLGFFGSKMFLKHFLKNNVLTLFADFYYFSLFKNIKLALTVSFN